MTKTDLSATATGLPTRRTLLAALPAVGFAPAVAAAGLPDLDPEVAKFAGAEERIRQFAEWFDLEVPPIEYDPEDVTGGPLLTDELFAWISDNGASFDWIFCGDAKGMAATFRSRYAKGEADPHAAWIAEMRRLSDSYNATGYCDDDPAGAAHLDAITDVEHRICTTPAVTPSGIATQLEFAIEEFCGPFPFDDDLEGQALHSVLASLRRLT